jgi:hypothetical protein
VGIPARLKDKCQRDGSFDNNKYKTEVKINRDSLNSSCPYYFAETELFDLLATEERKNFDLTTALKRIDKTMEAMG